MRWADLAKRLVFAALATCAGVPSVLAETLTLSRAEIVRRASTQNPRVAAQRAEVARFEALRGQADAAQLPEITFDVGVGPSLRATLVPGTAVQSTRNAYSDVRAEDLTVTLAGRLSVLQPLYTFGKISHRQQAADHGLRAAEAQVEMTRAEVALEALRLYETWLFARDTVTFLEDVKHVVMKSIEYTEHRLDEGASDVGDEDLLRLQAAASVAELGLSQARAGVAQTTAGLRAWLGLPNDLSWVAQDERLEPAAVEPSPLENLLSQAVQTALENRPELTALSEGAQAFTELAEAEFAGWWPNFFAMINISAAYTYDRDLVDTRFVVDPLYHFVPVALVGMRWSLQPGMASRRADEMHAERLRLQALESWARQGIPAQVEAAWQDVQRARRDLESASEGVARSKQWVVRASADYSAGFGDSRGVTDAVQAYAALRMARLDAALRLNVGLAELHQAVGTLVTSYAQRGEGRAAGEVAVPAPSDSSSPDSGEEAPPEPQLPASGDSL